MLRFKNRLARLERITHERLDGEILELMHQLYAGAPTETAKIIAKAMRTVRETHEQAL